MNHVRRNFLSLPDSFEAHNSTIGTSAPIGIISRIRSYVSDITSYVEPSYGGTLNNNCPNVETLVNWNSKVQVYNSGAYLQIGFKHGYVYPTSYAIKGYNSANCFATSWTLYGLNTNDEEMTEISTNKSEGSTFCNGGNTNCYSDN